MSVTEEQVRYWVKDELRKILDSGLIANETVKPKQPQTEQTQQEKLQFDPDICEWQNMNGERGPYQLCNKDVGDYGKLLAYLQGKEGTKATLNGMFYWLFKDGKAIGRKVVTKQ